MVLEEGSRRWIVEVARKVDLIVFPRHNRLG